MLITKDALVSKEHDRIPNLAAIQIEQKEVRKYYDVKTPGRPIMKIHKDNCKRRRNNCVISALLAFVLGLVLGVLLVSRTTVYGQAVSENTSKLNYAKRPKLLETFSKVSFTETPKRLVSDDDIYPKGMTDDMKDILKDNRNREVKIKIEKFMPNNETVLFDNVYWGPRVENSFPEGYDDVSTDNWEDYVKSAEVIKMEEGCGRMQNRLVTFKDGLQACVRYRQNTDQIQGEIFSFYVARLMNLSNLAPSVISLVDLKKKLWQNVASDIATAQWNTNRAVVLTQYIPGLESARIPEVFKPSERHLNKFDVNRITFKENDTIVKNVLLDKLKKRVGKMNVSNNFDHINVRVGDKVLDDLVELAQWSDLIVFDYLTANLDRIVNNLFNFQWNVNIMDGPAHNLARKMSGLLIFLDNESGLLHGYRLLKKYNVYHNVMLDHLCVFRKRTIDSLKELYENKSIGKKIIESFKKKNNAVVRDILPPLPEKNIKILTDRVGKILNQVRKCEETFSKR